MHNESRFSYVNIHEDFRNSLKLFYGTTRTLTVCFFIFGYTLQHVTEIYSIPQNLGLGPSRFFDICL